MSEIKNKALTLAKQYATEHEYGGEVAEAFIDAFVGAFVVNFEKGEENAETARKFLNMGLSVEQVS